MSFQVGLGARSLLLKPPSWQRKAREESLFPIHRLSPFYGKLAGKLQVWGCMMEIKITGMKDAAVLFHLVLAFAGAPIIS